MDIKRILLVEDDPLMQKLYSDLLKSENYDVDTAFEGISALEKMKHGGFDLVLMDIVLPNLGGVEIVKKLQNSQTEKPNKKIVFLTNLDSGSEIEEIKKLGFDFLVKSNITPDQFISKVKSLLP